MTTEMPYPLGRLKRHDPRSRAFAYDPGDEGIMLNSMPNVAHRYAARRVLDQGSVGACTGFSAATALNCRPHHKLRGKTYKDADGLFFYHLATVEDPWPGVYEPDDTGSSGVGAAEGLRKAGIISSYHWTFTLGTFLAALVEKPISVGTNWYADMFETGPRGVVTSACRDEDLVGGHQYTLNGYDRRTEMFRGKMAWGPGWGVGGTFWMPATLVYDLVFNQGGDAVVYTLP